MCSNDTQNWLTQLLCSLLAAAHPWLSADLTWRWWTRRHLQAKDSGPRQPGVGAAPTADHLQHSSCPQVSPHQVVPDVTWPDFLSFCSSLYCWCLFLSCSLWHNIALLEYLKVPSNEMENWMCEFTWFWMFKAVPFQFRSDKTASLISLWDSYTSHNNCGATFQVSLLWFLVLHPWQIQLREKGFQKDPDRKNILL